MTLKVAVMKAYTNKILKRIRGKGRGWVFAAQDFTDITSSYNTVNQILSRLAKQKKIRNLCHGIYDFPIIDNKVGMISPSVIKLAKALARQTGDIIQPNGDAAANALGLDDQVPARMVFLTSGRTGQRNIVNTTIRFKHSKLVVQFGNHDVLCRVLIALKHLGKGHINEAALNQCKRILSKKDQSTLAKAIPKLPQWMTPCVHKLIGNGHGDISKPL